jgi:chromosome segregation ATPase
VSEYVKHNCAEATINLYLQGERETDFIKITRAFTNQDRTVWSLNNQKASLKEVMNCIKQYNIQVDNLCQFLPQDRVQEFAKLNQQQLLKETQTALCRTDLIEKQESLIEYRETHKTLVAAIDKNNTKLQEAKDANLRLEGKIENFSRKKQFLSRIQDIDRKVAWLQYDNVYEKLTETKADLTKATQIYEKHKNAAKPLEDDIHQAKDLISQLQKTNSNIVKFEKVARTGGFCMIVSDAVDSRERVIFEELLGEDRPDEGQDQGHRGRHERKNSGGGPEEARNRHHGLQDRGDEGGPTGTCR